MRLIISCSLYVDTDYNNNTKCELIQQLKLAFCCYRLKYAITEEQP